MRSSVTQPGDGALAGAYRTLWLLVSGTVHVVGLAVVATTLPWQGLVAVFLPAALLAASLALTLESVTSRRVTLATAGRVGAVVGVAVLTAVGLSDLLGGPGLLLLGAVYLARPGAVRRLRELWGRELDMGVGWDPDIRLLDAQLSDGEDPVLAVEPIEVPDHLSDRDLCLAWESSTLALQLSSSVEGRAGIVESRQACIDELERRQPEALRRWLADGGDPTVSPLRYLAS